MLSKMNNQLTNSEQKEINSFLNLSDDQLFIELAKSENMQGLPQDLVKLGKERFKIIKDNLKSAVCKNETVRRVFNNDNGKSEIEIVLAIGTALNVALPGGAYVVVAVLLFRYGLNNLCAKEWT